MNGVEFHMKWCGLIDELMPKFFVECDEHGLHPIGIQSSYGDHKHLNVKLSHPEFFSPRASAAARAAFPQEMVQDWLDLRHAMFNTIAKRARRGAN